MIIFVVTCSLMPLVSIFSLPSSLNPLLIAFFSFITCSIVSVLVSSFTTSPLTICFSVTVTVVVFLLTALGLADPFLVTVEIVVVFDAGDFLTVVVVRVDGDVNGFLAPTADNELFIVFAAVGDFT